jgi:ubiquinone/menaquinone biosynthesis C-methylase UbiE
MSLTSEYKRQFRWRDWERALSGCPIQPGQGVLDLGCGPGDISRELAKRGAVVAGVDSNQELIAEAQANCPGACAFLRQDLRSLSFEDGTQFDGLWCSFTPAYFTDFEPVLRQWLKWLKPKAWVCLIEADNLLGHRPIKNATAQAIGKFYEEAWRAGRYDFYAGRKLELKRNQPQKLVWLLQQFCISLAKFRQKRLGSMLFVSLVALPFLEEKEYLRVIGRLKQIILNAALF